MLDLHLHILPGVDDGARTLAASVELARAVVADCRAFAGGELGDDCAIVVIKRTGDRA